MSSRASEVGFRDYLSHKSVKSYTTVVQTLFFVVVSVLGGPDDLQFKVFDMVIFM